MAHMLQKCPTPAANRRYATQLWVCPDCGQAWQATRTQPASIAPTVLSWWWRRWPWIEDDPRMEDN